MQQNLVQTCKRFNNTQAESPMTLVFIIIFSQVNDHLQQKKLCFIGPPWIAEIPIPVSGLFPVRRC